MLWKVSSIKIGELKAMSSGCRPKLEQIWQGVHHETNHTVVIEQRSDRALLLSVKEQSRQLGQVRVDLFGPLPEPQPSVVPLDNATLGKAVDFLKPLAMKYCDGTFKDKIEMMEQRDKELKKQGIIKVGKQPRKRPAAMAKPPEGKETDT